MLDHLGEHEAHDAIVQAITKVLSGGDTRDAGYGRERRVRKIWQRP